MFVSLIKKLLRLWLNKPQKDKSYKTFVADQQGQAMIYVAILILVLVGGAFAVYDIGRLINSRIQFQNAADSASLSAVAVKINKHHVDELLRAAMTQEAIIAQAEWRAAQAVIIQMVTDAPAYQPDPNNPAPFPFKDYEKRFKAHVNKAYRHITKFHRERLALDAYYKWLKENGQTGVREAAQLAFQANIKGYDDKNNPILRKNLEEVLALNNQLLENRDVFSNIGGVSYPAEGSNTKGNFGKTYVEIKAYGVSTQEGNTLLKYFPNFNLNSAASAQIASSKQLKTGDTPVGNLIDLPIPGIKGLTSSWININWYSPRLMAVEAQPVKIPH